MQQALKLWTTEYFLRRSGVSGLWSCNCNLVHTELDPQDPLGASQSHLPHCDTTWVSGLTAVPGGGESHVLPLWSNSKFWPILRARTHTYPSEALEWYFNCCVSCYYTTSGLCLLKVWQRNEEAGEQKGNTWRCFSGCLKTCEGTWNTQLLCLHTGVNPDAASGRAGGENRAV